MKSSSTRQRYTKIGTFTLLMTSVSIVLSLGCGMFRGRGGGSTPEEETEEAFVGEMTFQNQTSEAICGVEFEQRDDHFASYTDRIEPGGTATMTLEATIIGVFITACEGDRFLAVEADSELRNNIVDGVFAFTGGTEQTFQERWDYLLGLIPILTTPALEDSALQAQLHAAVQVKAASAGWADTPAATVICTPEWWIFRNNLTSIITRRTIAAMVGHRFNDGHCGIQVHTFEEVHTGNDWSGNVHYEGASGNIGAGCAMVTWMEARMGGGGAAPTARRAAPSAGGGCSNTCNSANDNECDDGGPGAQYSVCALGTDCADCGSRGGATGVAAPSSGGSCTNTCNSANDNECDDGGPGAQYSVCALGTDCSDCGTR